jgi:7,8-dihydropterin-6-yl-methyl-4-(beta-D-ribofuranosyl)aminobenzene 5'-phosphate synthase
VCGVDCPFTIVGASSPRAPLSTFASSSRVEALRPGLRDLGWVEGKNIVIEFRWADGVQHLPELAAELVRMNVAEMRYYNGTPPDTLKLGRAWQDANILRRRPRSLPGITLIALVSETPGTRELKELSLAVNTPDGLVLVVGCSHPGIEKIVEAATAINPKIHLIAGGFHLVVAPDEAIAKMVAALKETFKVENVAPGHCTGEPTFAALKQAFGNRYIYAGVGSSLALGPSTGAHERPGEGPVFEKDELTAYRKLARREDPFGVLQARSSRSQFLHSEGE